MIAGNLRALGLRPAAVHFAAHDAPDPERLTQGWQNGNAAWEEGA